jgi:outer membrane usher protein
MRLAFVPCLLLVSTVPTAMSSALAATGDSVPLDHLAAAMPEPSAEASSQASPRGGAPGLAPGPQGTMPPALRDDDAVPVLYAVRINGQPARDARLLRRTDASLFVRLVDLLAWRIRPPGQPPMLLRGEAWHPLAAFAGASVRIDESRQTLAIDLPSENFESTLLADSSGVGLSPTLPGLGAFFNYDTFLTQSEGVRRLDGQFEAGLFTSLGVATNGMIARDVGGSSQWVRLDTTLTRDFPAERTTLTVGDAIGSSGLWGRAVRFGGLRYGTNFATAPGFVSFPLPNLRGEAVMPSATDIYVDGVLRRSAGVPPGPFQLNNLPVVTGQGEVRVVTRDLLGREQVTTLPYYASTRLLRQGLSEASWEIGAIRQNYGSVSDDYGRALATVQQRHGVSDVMTVEGRLEALREQQTVGAGASFLVSSLGVMSAATALSHGTQGSGQLLSLALERQALRGVSLAVRSQWTSSGFSQVGLQPGHQAPLRLMSASMGFSPSAFGSFGLALIRQDNRDAPSTDIAQTSYTFNLGVSSAVILNAYRSLSGERNQAFGILFSTAFGERGSASMAYTGQAHGNQTQLQVQRSLPEGSGTGYRLAAADGDRGAQRNAAWLWQTDIGSYALEAGQLNGTTSYRASASGGAGLMAGQAFASRKITDSFAIAQVPAFPGVGVYLNNQPVARTAGTEGYAVLPRLLPYQVNRVAIDPGDLPMDVQIDATTLDAIPYYRSGVMLRFPVRGSASALVVLRQVNGEPVPVGSEVRLAHGDAVFPVAERGEVHVMGIGGPERLQVRWEGGTCEASIDPGDQLGRLPRIGPVVCTPMSALEGQGAARPDGAPKAVDFREGGQ